jgi:hypothetical protein
VDTATGNPSAVRTLAAIGLTATVSQSVLLREAMSALGGSELAWGGVLSVWLAGVGLGSWAGARSVRGSARLGPPLCLATAALAVVLLRALPALTGAAAGESPTMWRGVAVWVAAVLLPALASGWGFPAAVAAMAGEGVPGRAYAVESLGAVAGGVAFSFLLAPFGSIGALACAAVAVAALALDGAWRWLALPLAGAAWLAVPAVERTCARASWDWSGRPGTLRAVRETREQRLEAASLDEDTWALYADGALISDLRTEPLERARAGVVRALAPAGLPILAVAAASEGLGSEPTGGGAAAIVAVEDDAGMLAFLRSVAELPGGPQVTPAPGVEWRSGEARRVLRSGAPWGAIVLLDGDPGSIRGHRTRSREFFRECGASLAPGGVLAVRVGVPDTFLGGSAGRLLATIYWTMRAEFDAVRALPGEQVWLLAGRGGPGLDLSLAPIGEVLRARGGGDDALLPLVLDPARATTLERWLGSHPEQPSTAARPRAVLLSAVAKESRGGGVLAEPAAGLADVSPGWLALPVLAAASALLAGGRRRGRLGSGLGVVVGLSSLGWWLLLLAAWQATEGSVYAEVGALSAAFMAGTVAGSWAACRRRPRLAALLAAGALLSVVIASGIPLRWPRVAVVPLLVASGILTGAAFPEVAARCSRETRAGAGKGFAADAAGAAASALAVGLIALPWAGMVATALALGAVLAAAAVAAGWSEDTRSG